MTRIQFLWIVFALSVGRVLWADEDLRNDLEDDAGSRPPNIVLILADDLGIGDVGAYGGEVIETPHINKLAESGVRCTDGYVSHPVCSPSRAGLVTGRYQQRHGWEFNPAGRDRRAGMSLGERTFADELKTLGYVTGMVGKWHLGKQRQHHPMSRGFDEYFGVLEGGGTTIAIRDERWKLIRYSRTEFTRADLDRTGRLSAPSGGWSMESTLGQLTLLYDLEKDPGETTNLAEKHSDVVRKLTAEHTSWAKGLKQKPILPPVRSTLAEFHGVLVQLFF